MLRFALYLCGRHADAEDIAAETFVRAWVADAPARSHSLRAYLFAIARNLYLKRVRRQRREGPMPADLISDAPATDTEIEARQHLHATLQKLARFEEVDRAALLLRALHGFSYEEIGSALGLTAGAARVKVHRLRKALEEQQ